MSAARMFRACLPRTIPASSKASIPRRPVLQSCRHKQPRRPASYSPFPGRGRPNPRYTRIGPSSNLYNLLQNNRIPVAVLTGTGAVIYFTNLETVPVTGRRRWNIISPELEQSIAGGGYEEVLQQFRGKLLPDSHPYSQVVTRVLKRLIPHSRDLAKGEWKVHVVNDPDMVNAFVMPGNKVFFFTGMLPMCKDESGIAAVLGHEIAHNVAHHAAEKMSRSVPIIILSIAGAYLFDISGGMAKFIVDFFLALPNSRAQEAEADHIGLMMMAASCYEPEAAVAMWQRMVEYEKRHGAPPQVLSTHPASKHRIETITGWLPEAKVQAESSECETTSRYVDDFTQAFGHQRQRKLVQVPSRPSRGGNDDDYFF